MDKRRTPTRDRIRKLYFEDRLPVRAIAAMVGVTTQAVYQHLAAIRDEDSAKAESA